MENDSFKVEFQSDSKGVPVSMKLTVVEQRLEGNQSSTHGFFWVETVLLWLAQGAVQYIGGKLMSAILGDSILSDIDKMIRNAIAEINAFTKRAIEENEVRRLVAQMESTSRNMRQYSNAKNQSEMQQNRFLLTDSILRTSESMSACASIGLPALFCYGYAVSLRLIALAALYNLDKSPSSKMEAQDTLREAREHLSGSFKIFDAMFDPANRLSIPNPPCRWVHDEFQPYGKCWLIIDGNNVQVHDGLLLEDGDFAEIVQEHRNRLGAQQTFAIDTIKIPVMAAEVEWTKAIAALELLK